MKYFRKCLVAFALLAASLLFPYAAAAENDIFFNGDIQFDLKNSYKAGEQLNVSIRVSNFEDFPMADAALIVDIVHGCETPEYPSQLSDCDNVIHEEVKRDLGIAGKSSIAVPFSFTLPSDLKKGKYRLDAYLRSGKAPVVGMGHIFLPGTYKSFDIAGVSSFPAARILRAKTHLNNVTGPVGALVSPGGMVQGEVFVTNQDTKNYYDLSLVVSVCSWDDTACDGYDIQKQVDFRVEAGETKSVGTEFAAPLKPDAYAVRFELKAGSRLVSLYRNRIIVSGEGAKIRKLYVDRPYYGQGESGTLTVYLSGSPDHYTKPKVYNATLKSYIADLQTNKTVSDGSAQIPELSSDIGLVKMTFDLLFPLSLNKFRVCSEILSEDSEKYDEYCYVIDSSLFASGKHRIELRSQNFDTESMMYSADICVLDGPMPATAEAQIMVVGEMDSQIKNYQTTIKECSGISFAFESGKEYAVLVNDLDAKEQSKFVARAPQISRQNYQSFLVPAAVLLFIAAVLIIMTRRRKA
ncbi:MAG: hypothetical protein HYX24_03625 [Candidatus Aenigmarchaeota archaeon]|nr:hypothetical protein [Candidatus Aenigmarchaeota archaeon]